MHVVFRESHGLEDTDAPFDPGQTPAELVVLSFSDSDLGAFAAGWHWGGGPKGELPTLRLCNLVALRHPASVDNYVEYEKARTHLYSAAHSWGQQGRGEVAVRMAAAQAHSTYSRAADRSIQFHGGFGFTHDCDAQLHRRKAIFDGALIGDAAYQRSKLAGLLFD